MATFENDEATRIARQEIERLKRSQGNPTPGTNKQGSSDGEIGFTPNPDPGAKNMRPGGRPDPYDGDA